MGNQNVAGAQFHEGLRIHYSGSRLPISIQVGDVNGDGNVDLVIANQRQNTLSVLRGLGDGSFMTPVDFGVGNIRRRQPVSVVVVDLNKDGLLDLIVANGGTNDVSVLRGNPLR